MRIRDIFADHYIVIVPLQESWAVILCKGDRGAALDVVDSMDDAVDRTRAWMRLLTDERQLPNDGKVDGTDFRQLWDEAFPQDKT